MTLRPDPPELAKAIDTLRTIYWREYGRGWREAVENVKRVLEQHAKQVADGEAEANK
jgi:hypothetical protein